MELHHLALRVGELARAEAFYSGTLGLAVVRRLAGPSGAPRSVWLALGGGLLMLERALKIGGVGPGAHLLALRVEDLAAWERRLAAAGVPVEARTEHTLYVRDPDGHPVALSRYPLAPAAGPTGPG